MTHITQFGNSLVSITLWSIFQLLPKRRSSVYLASKERLLDDSEPIHYWKSSTAYPNVADFAFDPMVSLVPRQHFSRGDFICWNQKLYNICDSKKPSIDQNECLVVRVKGKISCNFDHYVIDCWILQSLLLCPLNFHGKIWVWGSAMRKSNGILTLKIFSKIDI